MGLRLITINELYNVFDNEYIEEYQSQEYIIQSTENWNSLKNKISLDYIALYIILNNPKPRKELEKDYLNQIRERIHKLKKKILLDNLSQFHYDFFCENSQEVLRNRLGIYAKYFERTTNTDINDIDKNYIKETKKKYVIPSSTPFTDFLFNTEDEVTIIIHFLKQIEETKEELKKLYKDFRNDSRNLKNATINPTLIDEDIKTVLIEKLLKTGIKNTKAKRLASRTLKAIKKEILKLQ